MKPRLAIAALISLLLLLAACSGGPSPLDNAPPPDATASPTEAVLLTPVQAATETQVPTATMAPTNTPAPTETAAPTSTLLPPPTETTSLETTPSATLTPEPSPTPEPTLLPAPLYLLSGEEGQQQIWRLERDGETLTQVTDEPEGVRGFDVSPVDGALVYITGDELVRADGWGGDRVVLYVVPLQEEPPPDIPVELTNPRWSPDGSQIAFGLLGLNLLNAATGEERRVLTNATWAELLETGRAGPHEFYTPEMWSPDGSQILVWVAYFQEGGRYALVNLADNSITDFGTPTGGDCCHFAWGRDGFLYVANDGTLYWRGGLWRVDPATGGTATLLQMQEGNMGTLDATAQVTHPRLSEDGYLYAWKWALGESLPELQIGESPQQPGMALQRVPLEQAGDNAAWEMVHSELIFAPFEAHWGQEGEGAVIWAHNPPNFSLAGGELRWIPASDEPSVLLPIEGHELRWGHEQR